MVVEPLNSLPSEIASALAREMDLGESLRWAGQPDARRSAWKGAAQATLLLGICGFFGTMMIAAAFRTGSEQRAYRQAGSRAPTPVVWAFGSIGVAMALVGFAAPIVAWPLSAARARRTVYAVTDTRVFSLRITRGGLARVHAVEPGHPLTILRRDGTDGLGDIVIHPRPRGPAEFTMTAIADTRDVERLIRTTFNP